VGVGWEGGGVLRLTGQIFVFVRRIVQPGTREVVCALKYRSWMLKFLVTTKRASELLIVPCLSMRAAAVDRVPHLCRPSASPGPFGCGRFRFTA